MIGTDTYEYTNMVRVTNYIQGTIGLPLILSIKKSGNIKWYIDAAFGLHKDMRSHTCGFMTMGTGGECVNYSKQNLETKSSNEADLVGVDNALNQVIWTLYFLKEQGYNIYNDIIYQDNQRSIKI